MTKKQLERFRGLLNRKMDLLMGKVDETVEDMTADSRHFPDPTDRASMESDRNFTLRIRDRERKLILKVQQALQRIDDGNYGVCDICGEPIDEKRLEARPEATQCIECKNYNELRERRLK